jgi:hypothetical protein
LGPIITAGVHPVIFTVFKDGNALRFLSDLLIALQAVDSTAKILPHSAADSMYVPLGRTKDIPTDSSAKNFVKAYLADLKMSEKGDMKGKVMIQMQAQFKNLKRNTKFRTWFEGSTVAPLRPVIKLDKTKLKGPRRITAGLFFNVVARHDMTENFELQITNALVAKTQISGPIPEFEVEVYSMHGSSGRVRLYRVFASSITDVQILNEKLAVIMPKPTADISYIPQKVWESLLRPKKTEYYNMQRHFALSHNALRFVGLKNARQLLAKTAQNVPAISIFTWLTRVRSTDNFILFPKVFLCDDGDIELWYHMSHDKETRAWLSTALAEIAKLSGINWEINPAAADAMFKQPLKVWNSLAKLKRGVSLPAQRSVFMEYSPPTGIITFPTRAAVQNRQRQGSKSFKLVYDMDVATTVSALTNDDTKSRASSKSRKSARNRANKVAKATASTANSQAVSSEQLAAKAAATQAIAIADAAVTKYPPKAPLAHQGAYDTISDAYGNRLPVVRIGDKWVSLTEDSLRESRKSAPPPNFGLAGKVQGTPNNQRGSTGSTVPATPSVATTTASLAQKPSINAATSVADRVEGHPATTQQHTSTAANTHTRLNNSRVR